MNKILILPLFLISINVQAQLSWTQDPEFQATQDSIRDVHGLAVDGEGKVWVQSFYATEPVIMNRDIGSDGIQDTLIARVIYIYNPDGTQASFSPLKFITYEDGTVDTLGYVWYPDESHSDGGRYESYSGRGLSSDSDGNIIISAYNRLYKIDHRNGTGIAKVDPSPGCSLTAASTDEANNVYVGCVVGTAGPIMKFAPDLTGEEAIVTIDGSYSRDMQVSGDGNTIWWAGYTNGAVHRFTRPDEFSSFGDPEIVLNGIKSEVFDIHPITGHLWVGAGSLNDVPSSPWTPQTWYSFDVSTLGTENEIPIDSIRWVPNAEEGAEFDAARPRGIDFSPNGNIAYVSTFAHPAAIQRFTNGIEDNGWGNGQGTSKYGLVSQRGVSMSSVESRRNYSFNQSIYIDRVNDLDKIYSIEVDLPLDLPSGITFDSLKVPFEGVNHFYSSTVKNNTVKTAIILEEPLANRRILDFYFSSSSTASFDIAPSKVKLNNSSMENIASGSVLIWEITKGDLDSDADVDAYDAAVTLNYSIGKSILDDLEYLDWEDWRIESGDVDNDGSVLAVDASYILQKTVGIISEFPSNTEAVAPVNVTYESGMLLFNSSETLIGFNVELPKLDLISFGEPQVIWNEVNKAQLFDEEKMTLGLASYQGKQGTFLGIPVELHTNQEFELEIITHTNSTADTLKLMMNASGVSNEFDNNQPQKLELSQNYPNPFNPSTQIEYALPKATQVTLEVFNSLGQKVMELVNGQQSAGYHTATFDASGLSSGVYLYKLTTPSFTETKKMLLIK
jgi:hypothetical protein